MVLSAASVRPQSANASSPQVRKFLLRYFPPGLIVEYEDRGVRKQTSISKVLEKPHALPLTNCAFNKSGDRLITGSYDQTCRVWNTDTAEVVATLQGHAGVVYAVSFNNPFGDRILTGSFDKTAKIWDPETGIISSMLPDHDLDRGRPRATAANAVFC